MKSYIELNSVYFLSAEGITLTMENQRIENTEETYEKLKDFIDKGYLKVVELDEADKAKKELDETQVNDVFIPSDLIKNEETNVKRFKVYEEEELKNKSKADLLEICKEFDIEAKATAKKDDLIKLIVTASKE